MPKLTKFTKITFGLNKQSYAPPALTMIDSDHNMSAGFECDLPDETTFGFFVCLLVCLFSGHYFVLKPLPELQVN